MAKAIAAVSMATAMLASVPARAADFIAYSIYATGTGFEAGDPASGNPGRYVSNIMVYFTAPYDRWSAVDTVIESTPTRHYVYQHRGERESAFERTLSALTIRETRVAPIFGSDLQVAATGSTIGTLPSGSFLCPNAACGTLRLAQGGIVDFAGTVTAVTTQPLSVERIPYFGFVYAIASVPEPATWATMIAGFALLGVALRRRSAATSYRFCRQASEQ